MNEAEFIPNPESYWEFLKKIKRGSFAWSSPSNIALIKYWGKREPQLPENPSISFTLNNCKTTTTLGFEEKKDDINFSFDIFLDGDKKDDFKPKITSFFKRIHKYLPFLTWYHFTIETSNTFPHSSGIASSASGMSALALCLMSVEKELLRVLPSDNEDFFFKRKASFLARLGSGSACRSIEGPLIVWGHHKDLAESSNLYGVKYLNKVHSVFDNYQDTILLVDKGEKVVSSTVGHNLMHGHPFAKERFNQASKNLSKMNEALQNGDLKEFIKIVESEALTLHAMMMTSMPYFILMKPNTLKVINKIWKFRKKTNSNVCFTLDAGANVHVLYPKKESDEVLEFIQNELVAYCENGQYICDQIGFGAKEKSI